MVLSWIQDKFERPDISMKYSKAAEYVSLTGGEFESQNLCLKWNKYTLEDMIFVPLEIINCDNIAWSLAEMGKQYDDRYQMHNLWRQLRTSSLFDC